MARKAGKRYITPKKEKEKTDIRLREICPPGEYSNIRAFENSEQILKNCKLL